ncbi:hypothetical protein AFCA_006260 [Aspergillus flavus]|uniref:Uncharacterized protein n=1 Tax=Aspergillus flavus TaxID=5059 RepID=A0AB74BX51_ASPFL|nr:hypothetical protein CA14_003542 [Aspergillus flavus]UDD58838.1 hypothetical protein AFCA_006260 [Aspergillus flavus]
MPRITRNDPVISVTALEAWTTGVDALKAAVDVTIESGKRTLSFNATAGSTMNGVFDPIDKIWAMSGRQTTGSMLMPVGEEWVAISDNPRHPNRGSELTDSIAFTPSKNGECTTRLCISASKRTVELLAGQ